MAQICKVCIHPDRQSIDAELSRNWERSLRAMGAEFGLSKDTLFRHAQRHLPQAPGDVDETEEAEQRQVAEVAEEEKEPDTPLPMALWTQDQWAKFDRDMEELAERIRKN
jgi:hypothetical protein